MSTSIDPHAKSYQGVADAYERGRPEYPLEAVEHVVRALGIAPGKTVLDLAAGTGKFTRQLAATGASLVAVEPVPGMREKLAANVPTALAIEGTAEAIPLPADSVDAVTVAQAFHWFHGREALEEMRRVLKPGAGLALIWNVRDDRVDWVRRLSELMDPHGGGAPRYHTGLWREPFVLPNGSPVSNGFTPLETTHFPFTHAGSPEAVVDRAGSTSFVAGLPTEARTKLLDDVRHMLREHPLTRGLQTVVFPYITEVHLCWKC